MKLRLSPVGDARVVFFNDAPAASAAGRGPDIVLVRPNETPLSHFFSGNFWENLGILTLATHLEQAGVWFGVLEASLFQCTRQQTVDLAVASRPRFIGISVYSTDMLDECLQIAADVKRSCADVHVVLGGHGASFVAQEILDNHEAVDAVIRGEGETSLLALVQSTGVENWPLIPGLSCRRAAPTPVPPVLAPMGRRPPVTATDLDDAPLPHRFVRDLIQDDALLSKTPLMLIASKGCFDRCAFCTITQFYSNMWRGRSATHVVDEVESLVTRYHARSVHFWDDTFIGPGPRGRRRAIEIASEIRARGLNITFHVTTRPSDLNEEVVASLAAAGLRSVFLGVESSEQSTLDYFGKHAKVEHATSAIRMLWDHGVHRIIVGFILFHPKMTWQGLREDLDYLESFPYVEVCRIVSRLTLYPGAQFWVEHRDTLGPDCYKRPVTPPLPGPEFEALYRACVAFYQSTLSIEWVFVCLEDQHLHDQAVIDFLAGCRTRLFRRIATHVRVVAAAIERGDGVPPLDEFCSDIHAETLGILDAIRREMGDAHFGLLLKAYQLDNYARMMPPPPVTSGAVPA